MMIAAGVSLVSVPSSTRASCLVRDVEMGEDEVMDGGERQLFLLPK